MPTRNIWMASEACEVLVRAERQYRQLFQLRRSMSRVPVWEPPVDVLETEREVLVFLALPGVDKDNVQAAIEGSDLVIAGDREPPPELRSAVIHRFELPRGRFERRVSLPRGPLCRSSAHHAQLLFGHYANQDDMRLAVKALRPTMFLGLKQRLYPPGSRDSAGRLPAPFLENEPRGRPRPVPGMERDSCHALGGQEGQWVTPGLPAISRRPSEVHIPHTASRGRRERRLLLGNLGDHGLRRNQETGDRCSVLQG
jgi:HSP20 family protein